jgi:hypothetical protein
MIPTIINSFIKTDAINYANVKVFSTSIEFKAFDPVVYRKELFKNLKNFSPNETDEVLVSKFLDDIKDICTLVAVRGTNLVNIMKNCSTDGIKRIGDLVKIYKIYQPKKNEDIRKKTDIITLHRIAGSFPEVMSEILKILPEKQSFDANIDQAYRFPHAPALIKKNNDQLKKEWIKWYIGFREMIGYSVSEAQANTWYVAVNNSPLISDDNRK